MRLHSGAVFHEDIDRQHGATSSSIARDGRDGKGCSDPPTKWWDSLSLSLCSHTIEVPWFAVGGGLLSELRSSGWIEVESERCELGSWFAKSELRAALRTRQRYDITPLFGAGLILLFYLNMIAVRRPARLRFREGLEEKFGERVVPLTARTFATKSYRR